MLSNVVIQQFVKDSLEKGEIRDDIIDEHHLLLYLRYSSERPKRTRKGEDIPGTFLGAVSDLIYIKTKAMLIVLLVAN